MVDLFVARTAHLIFAAIWAGSVFYVAFVVLPLARDGEFNSTAPLEVISGKLTTITRVSALVLLLTGVYLGWTFYTVDSLIETTNGQFVIAKVVLWLVLSGLVEVGASRFESGLNGKKLREPAANVLGLYRLAAVVAIALLVLSGAINSGLAASL